MNKLWKLGIVSVVCVTLALSLSACGKKDSSAKDSKTITVTEALSEDEWKVMRNDILPEFTKETGIKVKAIQVEASDVQKKLAAMKGAKNMTIDVVAQDVNSTQGLVQQKLVQDMSINKDIIPKQAIGKIKKSGEFNGKTYFFPYRPNVEINYYNEDVFNKYSLKAPTTTDELYKVAKTLKEKKGQPTVALKLAFKDVIEPVEYIRAFGGDPLKLTDKGTIAAYEYLQKLWPYLSPDTQKASFDTVNTFLSNGEVDYAPNWPFAVSIVIEQNNKKNIKANSGISGPAGQVKTLGGEVLGVTNGTKHKAEAIKFIKFMEKKSTQKKLLDKNGWPSFREDVTGEVSGWKKPYFNATEEALKTAQPLPNPTYWPEASQAINDALKEVVLKKQPVKQTMEKYQKIIDAAKASSTK